MHRGPAYVTSVDVGNQPCAVEGGFGSVWVSVYGDDMVLRVDPSDLHVIARIPTGFSPCGIAVGAGAVWVENYAGDTVTRVDPSDNTVADTIDVGNAPYDVTFAAGAAWVTNFGDDTVTRIDAADNATRTIKTGISPTGLGPARGAVWVADQGDGSLVRIDAGTAKARRLHIGGSPTWTAWGGGDLWVADGQRLVRIDPATGRPTRRVLLHGNLNDGDIVGDRVWVSDQDGRLHGLDRSGRVLGQWRLGVANPFVLAGYAHRLWLVDFAGTRLLEVDPSALP